MLLRNLREKKFMTLVDLARKAEVSAALVSLIERGKRYPKPKTKKRMAELGYGITVELFDMLYEGTDNVHT